MRRCMMHDVMPGAGRALLWLTMMIAEQRCSLWAAFASTVLSR